MYRIPKLFISGALLYLITFFEGVIFPRSRMLWREIGKTFSSAGVNRVPLGHNIINLSLRIIKIIS